MGNFEGCSSQRRLEQLPVDLHELRRFVLADREFSDQAFGSEFSSGCDFLAKIPIPSMFPVFHWHATFTQDILDERLAFWYCWPLQCYSI